MMYWELVYTLLGILIGVITASGWIVSKYYKAATKLQDYVDAEEQAHLSLIVGVYLMLKQQDPSGAKILLTLLSASDRRKFNELHHVMRNGHG
jgi:MFS superfamily sulfate permease-like transporter